MDRFKYYIFISLSPLLYYPLYYFIVNLFDSFIGDQQLINWIIYDSRSLLLKMFFNDWVDSLLVSYMFFSFLLLPAVYFLKKIGFYSFFNIVSFLVVVSAIFLKTVGFNEIAIYESLIIVLIITVVFHVIIQLNENDI